MSEQQMVYVKLKDPRSIFRDAGAGITIQGDSVFKVPSTKMVTRAIVGGALIKISDTEGKKLEASTKKTGEKTKGNKVEASSEKANTDSTTKAKDVENSEEASPADEGAEEESSDEESIEELKTQYEEKFGKKVPNSKAKDVEWISKKLSS